MKKILFILLFPLAACSQIKTQNSVTITVTNSSPVDTNVVDVFIVAGQSNADGRVGDFTLVDFRNGNGEVPGVFMWERVAFRFNLMKFNDAYRSGSNALNHNLWAFDVFTLRMMQQNLNRNIYVVKRTVGGTALIPTHAQGSWHYNYDSITVAGKLLQQLEIQFDSAVANITRSGKTPKVRAFLWHQGESDTGDPNNYQARLTGLIAKVREFTNTPNLKCFIGTVPAVSAAYNATIRQAKLNIQAADANVFVIDLNDLTLLDAFHFDANSAKTAGIRYYNKLIEKGLTQ